MGELKSTVKTRETGFKSMLEALEAAPFYVKAFVDAAGPNLTFTHVSICRDDLIVKGSYDLVIEAERSVIIPTEEKEKYAQRRAYIDAVEEGLSKEDDGGDKRGPKGFYQRLARERIPPNFAIVTSGKVQAGDRKFSLGEAGDKDRYCEVLEEDVGRDVGEFWGIVRPMANTDENGEG